MSRPLIEDAMRVRRRSAAQRHHGTKTGKRPDPKKSRQARARWRKGRAKLMRGIKKFTRSAKGRAFHAKLGRFNSRDTRQLSASVNEEQSGWSALIDAWEQLAAMLDTVETESPALGEVATIVDDALAGARKEATYRPEPEPEDWEFLSEVHGDLMKALRSDDPTSLVEAVRSGRDPMVVLREATHNG